MIFNDVKNNIERFITTPMKKDSSKEIPNKNNAGFDKYNEAWAFVMAIDLVEYKKQLKFYKKWAMIRIIQSFTSTVIKIGRNSDYFIDSLVNGDEVILIFKGNTKNMISNLLEETVVEVNSAINYLMPKLLKNNGFNHDFKAGIGCWVCDNNSLVLYGEKGSGEKDITLMGESINFASALSKISNRKGRPEIIFNDLVKINLVGEAKKTYDKYGAIVTTFNNTSVYGYSVRYNHYVK